jgi:hypothetical protein
LAEKIWSGVEFSDLELRGAMPNTPLTDPNRRLLFTRTIHVLQYPSGSKPIWSHSHNI